MRIALINVYDDDNRGSCALTWAALDILRRTFPGAGITIVPTALTRPDCEPFRHTASRYPDVAFVAPPFDGTKKSDMVRAALLTRRVADVFLARARQERRNPGNGWIGAIRDADLVAVRGGVSLHTCDGSVRGDFRFLARLLPLLAAEASGKPTALLGAQIGPLRTVPGGLLFRRVLRKTHAVVARDSVTSAEVQKVVPQSRVLLAPDCAFGLALESKDMSALFVRRGLDPAQPTLALVISSALRSDESVESHAALLASAASALLGAELIRQILIVVQAEEDRAASGRLAALLGLRPTSIVDEDLDPAQLASLYAACRLTVSSRLHGVILSLLGGTAAVSVAPEVTFKEKAVLSVVGLADLCVGTKEGPERLSETCIRVAADTVTAGRRIDLAVRAAQQAVQTTIPAFLRGLPMSGTRPARSLRTRA